MVCWTLEVITNSFASSQELIPVSVDLLAADLLAEMISISDPVVISLPHGVLQLLERPTLVLI